MEKLNFNPVSSVVYIKHKRDRFKERQKYEQTKEAMTQLNKCLDKVNNWYTGGNNITCQFTNMKLFDNNLMAMEGKLKSIGFDVTSSNKKIENKVDKIGYGANYVENQHIVETTISIPNDT